MNFDSYSQKASTASLLLKKERRALFAHLNELVRSLSPFERLALYVLAVLLGLSTLVLLAKANAAVSVDVPSRGGSLTEGLVGPARFINPVLAMSQADGDIATLVYSGLTRALPDGTVIPDIPSTYEIPPEGTVDTFTIREDAIFHDGAPVTAADVLYT